VATTADFHMATRNGAPAAIEFHKSLRGANEHLRIVTAERRVVHAELANRRFVIVVWMRMWILGCGV
jgi:hypothetical protein